MNLNLKMTEKTKLQINSLNVRGLNNSKKRQTIFQWFKKSHPGITMLQETHSTETNEKLWKSQWGQDIEFCHGTSQSRGVAILFDKNYDYEILNVQRDFDGRFLLLDILIENQPFVLVNIYAPTKDDINGQLKFLEFVVEKLSEYVDQNIIIGGDYNICSDPSIDKLGGKQEKQSASAKCIKDIQETFNLIDVWRVLNENKTRFTWRGVTKHGRVSSRLDYWLISSHLLYDLDTTDIYPSIKTDHSLIQISLTLKQSIERGRGLWKLNNSLLKDEVYVEKIKTFLGNCNEKYRGIENRALVWDAIKCEIRGITISYSIAKCKQQRKYINDLKLELKELEIKLDNKENVIESYSSTKNELEKYEEEILQGTIIRSRAKWIEDGEKCSKYFLQLEKRNYKSKCIKTLCKDKQMLTEHNEILDECKRFYETLYTENDHSNKFDKCTLFEKEHPVLNETEQETCDKIITADECHKSVQELPNNKSPGSDGLSIEFYKLFWREINIFLIESYDYSFDNKILSLDQRRAVLTLIPKGSKDIRQLKNWRPISLLNADYKIIAKVLANRLQTVISNLVSADQVGYIKGRYIGDNIRTMLDMLEITNSQIDPGLMVLVDFEKAFDTVSWNFLHRTLKFFNFGQTFQMYIKLLYTSPQCSVSNNGYHTEFFETSRGIRQGCPISALLFLLCAEVLAINIRCQPDVKGITLNNHEIKITQFADDTCLYLNGTNSLENVLKIFEDFYRYAGLKLNKEKTDVIWLGKHNRDGKICDINIINKPTKVLGIWICKNMEEIIKINLEERKIKLMNLLNMWGQRNLSIKGKITILRSQAMPIILFTSNFLYVPPDIISDIENIVYKFIWPNGKHHVKKSTLIEDISRGGLKMPDIYSMIKANKLTWVKRIILNNNNCSKTAQFILKTDNLSVFLNYKNNTRFLPTIPKYYMQLLDMWYSIHNTTPETPNDVLNENLWNNESILIGNKIVFNKLWKRQGIVFVKDILIGKKFMTKAQLETKYDIKCETLFYHGLKSAIPKKWIDINNFNTIAMENNENTELSIIIDKKKVKMKDINCKQLYWAEVHRKGQRPTSYFKWESEFYYATFNWNMINCIPYECARETSLQSLQYKIIHRFYPCGYTLNLWKLESDKCNYCEKIDTLQHHFVDCEKVGMFWRSVKAWCLRNFQFTIEFGTLDILLGIPNEYKNLEINTLNFIILFGKNYIKTCKNAKKAVDFYEFQITLKNRMVLEKLIFCANNNEIKFEERWSNLADNL